MILYTSAFKHFRFFVLNANLDELKRYLTCKKNLSLHVDSNEVAKLINQSKFAIITPSVMVH
ncbi:hypothetical protein N8972_02395, partial [Sulfurospirillum sp.]|nr:hypothetical protein [Sulfurospirillum sp.]